MVWGAVYFRKVLVAWSVLILEPNAWANGVNEWSLGLGHGEQNSGQMNSILWSQWVFHRSHHDGFDLYAGTSFSMLRADAATNKHTETFSALGGIGFQLTKHLYVDLSIGPSFLTERRLGGRTQDSHFSFQNMFLFRYELQEDVSLKFGAVHYTNGGLSSPNESFDVYPLVGVQFTSALFY